MNLTSMSEQQLRELRDEIDMVLDPDKHLDELIAEIDRLCVWLSEFDVERPIVMAPDIRDAIKEWHKEHGYHRVPHFPPAMALQLATNAMLGIIDGDTFEIARCLRDYIDKHFDMHDAALDSALKNRHPEEGTYEPPFTPFGSIAYLIEGPDGENPDDWYEARSAVDKWLACAASVDDRKLVRNAIDTKEV